MQQLFGVILVLLALWGTVVFLKRQGFAIANKARAGRSRAVLIQQLDRLRLTPNHSIHLLKVADTTILISLHQQGVTVLHRTQASGPSKPGVLRGDGADS